MVNFRYSDTDFIAYLFSVGYNQNKIEVTRDRNNQLRVYFYFLGEKEDLINKFKNYEDGKLEGNIKKFCVNRRVITKMIKSELLKYQANELSSGLEKSE